MVSLLESSKAIDFLTLTESIRNGNQLEVIGGASFISSLIDDVPRLTNLEHYARIVQEKSTLRSLIKHSSEIISSCYEQQEDVEGVLDNAEKAIFKHRRIQSPGRLRQYQPTGQDRLQEDRSGSQPAADGDGDSLGFIRNSMN